MLTNNEFKKAIEKRIKALLDTEIKNIPKAQAKSLLRQSSKQILVGGKRFRPILLKTIYEAYGGNNKDLILHIGVVLELLHQALLIHDDFIDNDNNRNGELNIRGRLRLEHDDHFSDSINLLAGDLLISMANKYISEIEDLTDNQKIKILNMLNRATMQAIYGQSIDIDSSCKRMVTLKIKNELKTASYTSILPAGICTLLLNLDNKESDKLNDLSIDIGVYFQLVNDHQNYFIKQAQLSDLQQAKITYPYISVINVASDEDKTFLTNIFGKTFDINTFKSIHNVLDKYSIETRSIKYLETYYKQIKKQITMLKLKDSSGLISLIDSLNIA